MEKIIFFTVSFSCLKTDIFPCIRFLCSNQGISRGKVQINGIENEHNKIQFSLTED